MISFSKFFTIYEALRLKDAKKQQLTRKQSGAYQIDTLNKVFGKKDRLVFDIDLKESELIMHHPLLAEIKDFIGKHLEGWYITRDAYIDGIIYHNDDKDKKQGRKIGRILNSLIPKDPEAERLLKAFKTDPLRGTKKNNYKVVISRHPYDIAGMSTDRNWTSCMNLGTKGVHYTAKDRGVNARYVAMDITKGSIVAYLVPGEDKNSKGKMEIRRPISRILMKPHENKENSADIAFSLGKTYGVDNLKFTEFIRDWLDTGLNKDAKGKYTIKAGLYSDGDQGVNFSIVDARANIGADAFFTELSDRYDNSKYERFFTFEATDPRNTTSFDLNITIEIPEAVPLESFDYYESYPKYIQEILNSEHLGCDMEVFRIMSDGVSTITIELQHFGNDGFTYEDESGNDVDLDRWEITEKWHDTMQYGAGVKNINYARFRKHVIEIIKNYDPVASKEVERQKLIERFNLIVSPDTTSVSPTLKDFIATTLADRPKFYQAREYFISLGTPTPEQMVEIVKTDEYRESLRFMHKYVQHYNNMITRMLTAVSLRLLAMEYPTLGDEAKQLWNELIQKHFGIAQSILFENPLRPKSISKYLEMMRAYMSTHTTEEYNFLKDIYDDQDTAFTGKAYQLDTV